MEDQRFDQIARTLAGDGTRRSFLRGLAAALALALPGGRALAAPPEERGCKDEGKKCKDDGQCCSGFCNPVTRTCTVTCQTNSDCDDGDPCTYDVCGALTGRCYHDPIPACVPCANNGDCAPAGICCDGRCCPKEGFCGLDGSGRETCCVPCGGGQCCDGYHPNGFVSRNCIEECGFCCNGGNGGCVVDESGNVTEPWCVLPGISR